MRKIFANIKFSRSQPRGRSCSAPAGPPQLLRQLRGPPPQLPAGSVQITGSGSTFQQPVMSQSAFAYVLRRPVGSRTNYQGTGSGGGKKAIVDNTVDFAGSDLLLKSRRKYDAGKDLQMYPMVASAVVPIYNIAFQNVPEGTTLPKLILDRQTLVDIYNGKITKWNDPAIVALNPDRMTLPARHYCRPSLRWFRHDRNLHQGSDCLQPGLDLRQAPPPSNGRLTRLVTVSAVKATRVWPRPSSTRPTPLAIPKFPSPLRMVCLCRRGQQGRHQKVTANAESIACRHELPLVPGL